MFMPGPKDEGSDWARARGCPARRHLAAAVVPADPEGRHLAAAPVVDADRVDRVADRLAVAAPVAREGRPVVLQCSCWCSSWTPRHQFQVLRRHRLNPRPNSDGLWLRPTK